MSGVAGIEVRCRDAIAQLVIAGLDDLAVEGMALLSDLKLAHGADPGTPSRTQIVTRLIGFHSRALLALMNQGAI